MNAGEKERKGKRAEQSEKERRRAAGCQREKKREREREREIENERENGRYAGATRKTVQKTPEKTRVNEEQGRGLNVRTHGTTLS